MQNGSFSLKHNFTHTCIKIPALSLTWQSPGASVDFWGIYICQPTPCRAYEFRATLLHTWAVPGYLLNLPISREAACHLTESLIMILESPAWHFPFLVSDSKWFDDATFILLVSVFFYFFSFLKITMVLTHLKSYSVFQLIHMRKQRRWKPSLMSSIRIKSFACWHIWKSIRKIARVIQVHVYVCIYLCVYMYIKQYHS